MRCLLHPLFWLVEPNSKGGHSRWLLAIGCVAARHASRSHVAHVVLRLRRTGTRYLRAGALVAHVAPFAASSGPECFASVPLAQLGVVWHLHTVTSASAPLAADHDPNSALLARPAWDGAPLLIDSSAVLLVPLLLPGITAIDLVVDRRAGGSLAKRVSTAALTVLTPLFWLLELRRLQVAKPASRSLQTSAVEASPQWEDWAVPCARVS